MAYRATAREAAASGDSLALWLLADQLDHGERKPLDVTIRVEAAE